jgi:hypothetical protein
LTWTAVPGASGYTVNIDNTEYQTVTNYDGTYYGIVYSVSKGTATATEIVIPSEYDGLLVIDISNFFNYWTMTSITIPSSVSDIGDGAFINCSGLEYIGDFVSPYGNNNLRQAYITGGAGTYTMDVDRTWTKR